MSITDELRKWAKEHLSRSTILAIADRIDAEHERQLEVLYRDMSDAEYVKLPKDADCQPIHIGDVMEWPDGSIAEVVGIGPDTFFYVENGEDAAEWSCASDKIHHHEPTVEDVLREFAFQIGQSATDDDIVAEYAAKLRLVGDGE